MFLSSHQFRDWIFGVKIANFVSSFQAKKFSDGFVVTCDSKAPFMHFD